MGQPAPHILIVDPHMFVSSTLAQAVGLLVPSAIVSTAADGTAAAELDARHPCQLLITECDLPSMDGLTLIRTLRDRGSTAHVIVLASDRHRLEGLDLALVTATFIKPVLLTELLPILARVGPLRPLP